MIVGIPKALIYWKRPWFWEEFFKNLGFEILVSPETNKEIVELGVKVSDPETCFSQKVYWGHLLWLDGKCDLIFVPRLKANEEKLEYCPKFFGIPDLAKILVHPHTKFGVGVKTSILTETFDPRKEGTKKTFKKLGEKLKKNNREIKKALENALLKEKELKEKKVREFFEKIRSEPAPHRACSGAGKQKIILISHPYNLYDEYVNLRVKEKLEKLGAEVIFIDEIPTQSAICNLQSATVKFHWEFGKEIMEKIQEILKHKTCPVSPALFPKRAGSNGVSGAIEISSFACGCDAVIKEFIEKEFKEAKVPFLYLIIDEHTGEAGFQTRLEAFMDTLSR